VQIISAPANQRPGRVGFVVGRKVLPRAVDRNRLKRLLREFLRASRREVRAFDLVVRLKRPVTAQTLSEVAREAAALIREATYRTSATPQEPR
jgi:ribonuclease P protein component